MKTISLFILLIFSVHVDAWDGSDWGRGTDVEIERENFIRPGKTIAVYDWASHTYNDYDVESVWSTGSGVEVEVYDWNAHSYKTFEME